MRLPQYNHIKCSARVFLALALNTEQIAQNLHKLGDPKESRYQAEARQAFQRIAEYHIAPGCGMLTNVSEV